LPGFYHRKAEPFLAHVIEINDEPTYALHEVLAGVPELQMKTATRPRPSTCGNTFWNRVNSAALDDRAKWVPDVFPSAKYVESTGCYRVTSASLGRNLQEDLILGADGIRQWGWEEGLTPIDCVMTFGTERTPQGAALWLCDRMGVDPEQLGYGTKTIGNGPRHRCVATAGAHQRQSPADCNGRSRH